MKVAEYYWDHPALKKFLKKMSEGQYLFRQGDTGDSMFIITQGIAELIAHRDGREHITSLIDAGDFLGEKAIVSHTSHQRAFSARAKTELAYFEVTLKDIEQIKKSEPELMADILKRIFQIAADRLYRTNQLVAALRSSDAHQRIVRLVLHMSRTAGRRVPDGIEIFLHVDSIRYFVDIAPNEIEQYLKELEKKGLLKKDPAANNAYLIPSEKELLKAAGVEEEHARKSA